MANVLRSAAYVLQRFVLQRPYLTAHADVFGLRFRVKTEDVVGRHIYKYGQHEPAMTRWLSEHIEFADGDVVIDIGANIGWYSLLCAQLAGDHDVSVVGFEPDPVNYSLFEQNVALNGVTTVRCEALALADENGTATLHQHSDSNRGRHSLLPINAVGSTEIATMRLDDYWREQGFGERVPRLIKIDIEGFELMALRGAPQLLERCPLLILEFSPAYMRRGDLDPQELIALLNARGGHIERLDPDGSLVPADLDALAGQNRQCDLICRKDVG
ncbi:MAG: FkbM family methyltransferase [Pseudomonadota bacterium]